MIMKFAYICDDGLKIGVSKNLIYIEKDSKKFGYLPINTLQGILIFGNCQASVDALSRLTKRGVRTAWLTKTGKIKFIVTGPHFLSENRIRQFSCYLNKNSRLLIARWITIKKIVSQAFFIKNYYRNIGNKKSFLSLTQEAVDKIKNKKNEIKSLDKLRGIEGVVSRAYFDTLKRAIKNQDFNFESRNYHPAKDRFNCALSFAYGFAKQVISSALVVAGFDPYIGFLHEFRSSKEALVYDIFEEFRPYVDLRVIKMINKKQIEPEMFVQLEGDEVRINPLGLKKIISLYHEEIMANLEPRYGCAFYESVGQAIENFSEILRKASTGELNEKADEIFDHL